MDEWVRAEWRDLPDQCLVAGCQRPVDRRGPVWLRGPVMHKACTPHWDAIMRPLTGEGCGGG